MNYLRIIIFILVLGAIAFTGEILCLGHIVYMELYYEPEIKPDIEMNHLIKLMVRAGNKELLFLTTEKERLKHLPTVEE